VDRNHQRPCIMHSIPVTMLAVHAYTQERARSIYGRKTILGPKLKVKVKLSLRLTKHHAMKTYMGVKV
jgi:hypothetical protein